MANIKIELVRQHLAEQKVEDLVQRVIEDDNPWLFRKEPGSYDALKDALKSSLGDQNMTCLVVGSAKFGYSFSPDSFGRKFSPNSDIDVAVCSSSLFEKLWNRFLIWRYPWHLRKMNDREKTWAQETMENHMGGAINPDELKVYSNGALRIPPEFREFSNLWFDLFKRLGSIGPAKGHVVEGRVYHSINHLKMYMECGLKATPMPKQED